MFVNPDWENRYEDDAQARRPLGGGRHACGGSRCGQRRLGKRLSGHRSAHGRRHAAPGESSPAPAPLTPHTHTFSADSATAVSQRDACITGACGSATVTWGSDLYSPAYVQMSVKDNDCDGHAAEIRFVADQSHLGDPYKYYGPWHVNNNGCNGDYIHANGYFYHNDPLYGFWVEVCVVGDTSRCQTSSEAYFS